MTLPQERKKIRPLHHDDKIAISRELQVKTLEEISRVAKPTRRDMVFHGGTGVSLVHGSPRWSEDLDFMATTQAVQRLSAGSASFGARLQLAFSARTPGAEVSVQEKNDPGEILNEGSLARWMVRWSHPEVRGVVKIKVEFYLCQEERLAAYPSHVNFPTAPEHRSREPLPCADLVAVWSDKIVAMASRPVVKYRDLHDLGYIAPLLAEAGISQADRISALKASMGIYGRSAQEIAEGLARPIVRDGIADEVAWFEDMRRWFAGEAYEDLASRSALSRLLEDFHGEFSTGLQIVDALCDADRICGREELAW